MTAPLTPSQPPHHQPSNDPWQTAPHPAGATSPYGYEEDGPGMKNEALQAVAVMVAVAVSGVLLGLLWVWLSPRVPLISDGQTVYLKDTEGEQAIGVDGTFTLLALGFGLVSGVVAFLLRKSGGVPLVAGLALGSLLGALLAWRAGIWLGPQTDVVAHAKAVGKGVVFDAPLDLKAKGTLLAWPVAALAVHLGLTALFGPRDPEPYPVPYGEPRGEAHSSAEGTGTGL
ncbi:MULTISPECIES: DUF2567 domain-containing protein [unclassified Streptomyces]|uniref:DUF2567 domain-containing protein n=1 Tax=unclassified Streptomyces TaxID=2593676 RepID=UPI001CBC65F6|nr:MULTISPECIES: DUF2567 domain-containing protein [unclassified Streptomyces]WPO74372.1 DUF2567 domain-containing protein [Streptomyces sp. KN37]